MNARRRGFTLIEVLVTIGIILVLVGIVMYGMSRVGDASKSNAVRTTLGNLRGMIAELEAKAGLASRQPAEWYVDGTPRPKGTFASGKIVWEDADPTSTPDNEPALVPTAPVTTGAPAARYNSDAVLNTQLIMQQLLAVPANKTMLGQFPPEQLMEAIPTGVTTNLLPDPLPSDRRITPALPLDSWGNPIIFVPAAGLAGDATDNDEAMLVGGGLKSDGTLEDGARKVVATPSANQVGPIRSPDNRPFWASAGPDGDFRTGDDNVYSFGN